MIVFFEEADALFAKRAEVKDAHDRYDNLEITYLLQRMEKFIGLAMLTITRKKDIDKVFLRRIHFVSSFP